MYNNYVLFYTSHKGNNFIFLGFITQPGHLCVLAQQIEQIWKNQIQQSVTPLSGFTSIRSVARITGSMRIDIIGSFELLTMQLCWITLSVEM